MKTILLKVEVPDQYDSLTIKARVKLIADGDWAKDALYNCEYDEITLPSEDEITKDMEFDDDIPDDCYIPDAVTGATWLLNKIKGQ